MRINYPYLYRDITNAYCLLPRLTGGGWALPPIQALIELTYRCNQRCSVCQFMPLLKSGGNAGRGEVLSTSEVRHIVDQLPPLALVTFTGGEPLLRPDLPELVAHAGKRRLVHVISNGSLLTPELARELLATSSPGMPSPGLFAFGISVQGNSRTHDRAVARPGGFARTLAGIAALRGARRGAHPLITLKTVINPETLPELPELFRLAEEAGADYFNPILENTGAHFERINFATSIAGVEERLAEQPPLAGLDVAQFMETLRELQDMAKKSRVGLRFTPQNVPPGDLVAMVKGEFEPRDHACNVFWNALYISAYGDFMACASHKLGSLREQSLAEIWNGEQVRKLRLRRKQVNVLPGCSGCCYLTIRPGRGRKYARHLPGGR